MLRRYQSLTEALLWSVMVERISCKCLRLNCLFRNDRERGGKAYCNHSLLVMYSSFTFSD